MQPPPVPPKSSYNSQLTAPPKSVADLAKEAAVRFDEKYSPKIWLNSAEQQHKQAEYHIMGNDLESAFKHYMRFCDIMINVPKHRDWARVDATTKNEYMRLKSELVDVLGKTERLKEQIKQRFTDYMTARAANLDSKPVVRAPTLDELNSNAKQLSLSSPDVKASSAPAQQKAPQKTPERIEALRLFRYFGFATPPKILVVDLRPRSDYLRIHLAGCDLVNIDPSILSRDGVTGAEIESKLSGFHRDHFAQRHKYDLVVYLDQNSTQLGQTPELERFAKAVNELETNKVLQRWPALVSGGMNAWTITVKSSPVRIEGCFGFGDTDGRTLYPSSLNLYESSSMQPSAPPSDVPLPVPMSQEADVAPTSPEAFENRFFNFVSNVHNQEAQMLQSSTGTSATMGNGYPPLYYPQHPVTAPQSIMVPTSAPLSGLPTSHPLHVPSAIAFQTPSPIPYQPSPNPANNILTSRPLNLQTPAVLPSSLAMPAPVSFQRHADLQGPVRRAPSPPIGGSSAQLTIHSSNAAGAMEGSWLLGSNGRGLVGMKNLGNTCYMNSTLQCLLATKPISAMFYDGTFRKQLNTSNPLSSRGQIANSFYQLVTQAFREENGVVISPSRFKEVIAQHATQFKGSDQQDSQEFLAFLLDGLHEDLNQAIGVKGGSGLDMKQMPDWARPIAGRDDDDDDDKIPEIAAAQKSWLRYMFRNDSIIVSIFQGQLQSQLKCTTCGKTSTTYNPFMYLSLPIPRGGSVRLADCLSEFIREETLDEGDSWKCPRCKVPRRATKKLAISRLPRILLIHLKRFSFHGPFRDKIVDFVDFPIRNLDLFPYLTSSLRQQLVSHYDVQKQQPGAKASQKYDLYAMSNHFGGLNGGHYTAIVRQLPRKAWFNYDDSRVTELCSVGDIESENRFVKTKSAYSLFYVSQAAV